MAVHNRTVVKDSNERAHITRNTVRVGNNRDVNDNKEQICFKHGSDYNTMLLELDYATYTLSGLENSRGIQTW